MTLHPRSNPAYRRFTDRRGQALRVVALGGGSGLSTLLKGLKRFVLTPGEAPGALPAILELTAVVTVTDDGGSSGRLRKEFHILPPDDIRNCLVAMSEDESLLGPLFQHHFRTGAGLKGHSFGNLFVTAVTGITGDFAEAVKFAATILATRGNIFPSTLANVQLEARMHDGSRVRGETRITASPKRIAQVRLVPGRGASRRADLITIGPGSLFTSLIPNLLVRPLARALAASPALKVFVCNLMTQTNESLGMTAADHVRAIYRHGGAPIFDVALVNRIPVTARLKAKYAKQGTEPILPDAKELEKLGVQVVAGDFLKEENGVARHASDAVARALMELGTSVGQRDPQPAATAPALAAAGSEARRIH
ncbi:MAG TPA: gluconeogenesis factor YvcK family protein [Terriglobales bacterium]|nr:gluconeogenesis factor YvcK family protein [Terriglobales bacterium]